MHLSQTGEKKIHISHLYHHISAWSISKEGVEYVEQSIREALVEAKKTGKSVQVDHDGEMFFMVHPADTITLCMPWKEFEIVQEE